MKKWLKNAVFYEIYPQTYCDSNGDGIGDLGGIMQKLEYIKSLGVNAIWLNPMYDSPFMDAGYDVKDYFKVAKRYGTNEEFKRLLDLFHENGLRIILDLVPGHTSTECEMFKKSSQPTKNEFSDRYIWTSNAWDYPSEFKIMSGMQDRDANYVVNFFSMQPALNYGFNKITHPEWQMSYTSDSAIQTREWLKSVMRFWLDMGVDGFRVDMADSLVKNDDDKEATSLIYNDIKKMMDKEYPDAILVAEWSNPGKSLKAGFDVDFYLDHSTNGYHALFRKNKDGKDTSFFGKSGNGNINDFLSDYFAKYYASKDYGYMGFITCNHDSPRMSKRYDMDTLKLCNAFILTQAGVPFIYYGDEIGMKFLDGLTSVEGGFSRTGTRSPMQWNSGKNKGFSTADKIYLPVDGKEDAPTVENQEKNENSLLNVTRKMIALRKKYPDLQADTELSVLYAKSDRQVFAYARGNIKMAINPSVETQIIPIDLNGEAIYSINGAAKNTKDGLIIPPLSFTMVKSL